MSEDTQETMTVDAAIAYVETHAHDFPAFTEDWRTLKTLAAEVRRLRELGFAHCDKIEELEAELLVLRTSSAGKDTGSPTGKVDEQDDLPAEDVRTVTQRRQNRQ